MSKRWGAKQKRSQTKNYVPRNQDTSCRNGENIISELTITILPLSNHPTTIFQVVCLFLLPAYPIIKCERRRKKKKEGKFSYDLEQMVAHSANKVALS